MYEDDSIIIYFLVGFVFLVIGALIGSSYYEEYCDDTDKIGQMVCNENDLGDFVEFENNKIHCKPLEKIK